MKHLKKLFRLGMGISVFILVAFSLWSVIVTEQAVNKADQATYLSNLYDQVRYEVSVENAQVEQYRNHPSLATKAGYQTAATLLTNTLLVLSHDGEKEEQVFARQAHALHSQSRIMTGQIFAAIDARNTDGLKKTDQSSIAVFASFQQLVNTATTLHRQQALQLQEELRSVDQEAFVVTIVAIGIGLPLFIIFWILLGTYHFRFEQVVLIDALTNLPNHRAIMTRLQEEVGQCQQGQQTCAIMFVDLDHFKRVNDTWGHLAGDAILRETGKRLQAAIHLHGIVGRYGGEEFAAVLKGADIHHASLIAEQARVAIAVAPCTWQAEDSSEEVSLTITASIGVAVYALHGTTTITLLEYADRAMYRAKQERNRVCIADVSYEDEHESILHIARQGGSQAEVAAVQALTAAIQAHDLATGAHAARMVALVDATACKLGCSVDELRCIRLAALLHDVGKIGIPEAILHKPASLTPEEWQVMRTHPAIGSNILLQIEGVLDQLAPIVGAHHERWDGQGYPAGLIGEAIPLGARIMSIVDSYDAMTSTRPYRQALPHEYARAELQRCAGTQYDPRVVEAFLEILDLQERGLRQLPEPVSM